MECVRDHELECMTSRGTEMSSFRGPLLLPLGEVRKTSEEGQDTYGSRAMPPRKGRLGEDFRAWSCEVSQY